MGRQDKGRRTEAEQSPSEPEEKRNGAAQPGSLLESDGFDSTAYSQKRSSYLLEIKSLDQKLKETRQEFDDLKKRNTDEAEFAGFVSEADAFKAVTHKIINLSFTGKQRLLHGVLDGPIVVGSSTLIRLQMATEKSLTFLNFGRIEKSVRKINLPRNQ